MSFAILFYAIAFLATLSSTTAFAPATTCNSRLTHSGISRCRLSAETAESSPPFDSYEIGQSTLAYKDEAIGEGVEVVDGDVVTVSFAGRLYPSGYQFSKNEDFVFQVGEGKTMPGFDKALLGTKVGCKRLLRVPPSLAFGTRGSAPKIPPNADLEFDIEVKDIARGAMAGNLAKIGTGRLLGFIACFAILAISPFLP